MVSGTFFPAGFLYTCFSPCSTSLTFDNKYAPERPHNPKKIGVFEAPAPPEAKSLFLLLASAAYTNPLDQILEVPLTFKTVSIILKLSRKKISPPIIANDNKVSPQMNLIFSMFFIISICVCIDILYTSQIYRIIDVPWVFVTAAVCSFVVVFLT